MLRRPNRNYKTSLPGGPTVPICSTLLVASPLQLLIELTVEGLLERPKVRYTSVPFQDAWHGYSFITIDLQ